MKEKTTIETQLDCRATASLKESVLVDLSKPDLPIASLLSQEDKKDDDESTDKPQESY